MEKGWAAGSGTEKSAVVITYKFNNLTRLDNDAKILFQPRVERDQDQSVSSFRDGETEDEW